MPFFLWAVSSVSDRSEIDPENRWDLSSIYADPAAWTDDREDLESTIEELAALDVAAIDDADSLRAALELRDEVMRRTERLLTYARMRRDQNTRDQDAQAMFAQAQSLYTQASSAASVIEPAIQQFDRSTIDTFRDAEPELATYEQYIDNALRQKPHTRSPEVEELLADLSEVTSATREIYQSLTNADLEFPTVEDPDGEAVEITLANFTTLQKRPDRDFRQRVYETFYDRWGELTNTIGTTYAKSVTTDVQTANARYYDSARAAALDGSNVPPTVYETLTETVQDRSAVLDRHAQLKQQVLDVDELRMWDLYVPLAAEPSPTVEYDTATDHIIEALGALGDDYQQRIADGLSSRWVDVYETPGKRSGAYSSATYDSHPYILMNYQDDVSSMYTLAHELGHSIHSQLANEHQPYVDSGYEIFVAEVASTVNEVLLTHHLLETVDDEQFRRHILNEYLERFRSTLFRQTMFATFEDRAHSRVEQDEPLTPDRLNELYAEIKGEFYPSAVIDDRIAREWMRIPHFYRAFYVYQYATGISAAVAIATEILDGNEAAVDRYLDALRLGGSQYPVEILETAGVDVTDSTYIEAAIDEYDRALDDMAALL